MEIVPLQPQLAPLCIPAYEPDPKFINLVDHLLEKPFPLIVVVNDGSSEGKREIFDELRRKERVVVLTHAVNLGKGAALKTAFNYILVNEKNSTGVITVDADGQHMPQDVYHVAQTFQKSPRSLALGARAFKGKVPLRSAFGNTMTRHIFHFLIGKKLQDTQTGLRAVPASLMRDLLTVPSMRYEFELDMLIRAVQNKVEVIELPIATVYEDGNKSSHFNPLIDSLRIYFVFWRFIFASLMTFVTDWIIFTSAYLGTRNIFTSLVVGRFCAFFVGFALSRRFVFKSKKNIKIAALEIFLLWLVMLGGSYGGIRLLVVGMHFNVYLARLMVDTTLFVFNFLIQREFIFAR